MVDAGVFVEGTAAVVSPLQAVVKDSDIEEAWAALVAANIEAPAGSAKVEGYVDHLNRLLVAAGMPKVKARLCIDLSLEVNRLLYDVPFRFPPVGEFVELLPILGWMCKVDFSRAFLNIPVHWRHHPFVALRWLDGQVRLLRRVLFGVKPGPCICS